MARQTVRKPIPWIMKSSAIVSSWSWETEHFIATVLAEGLSERKMYTWKIADKSSGHPVPFESNTTGSFDESVEELLDVIGKAYDRKLGYQAYAGTLATTFKVFDGRKIDFGPIIGRNVTMYIKNDADLDDDIILNGQLDVDHYDITIHTSDNTLTRVPPSYVKIINDEFSLSNALDENEINGRVSKNGKIFQGDWQRGCTGKPGFNPHTVVHGPGDQFCPIHQV